MCFLARAAKPADCFVAVRPTGMRRRDARGACPERSEGLTTGKIRPVFACRGSLAQLGRNLPCPGQLAGYLYGATLVQL